MTQREFSQDFKKEVPNYREMSCTDRRLHYNDLMQVYYENKLITRKQLYNWGHPKFITKQYPEDYKNAH